MKLPYILLSGKVKFNIFRNQNEVTVIAITADRTSIGRGNTLKEALREAKRILAEAPTH